MSEHFIGKDNVEIYDNCEQRYTKSHLNSTNANLALNVLSNGTKHHGMVFVAFLFTMFCSHLKMLIG